MLSGLKHFGLTFAVSLIIFGLVSIPVFNYVSGAVVSLFSYEEDELNNIIKNQTGSDTINGDAGTVADPQYADITGNSFTMLLVATDYRPDVYNDYYPTQATIEDFIDANSDGEWGIMGGTYRRPSASGIILIRADKERGEYTTTPIPAITKINTSAGSFMLGEAYYLFGEEFFVSKIEAMTGIHIDRYAIAKAVDVPDILAQFGAVSCDVPCDIYTDGTEYFSEADKAIREAAEAESAETDADGETVPAIIIDKYLERGGNTVTETSEGLLIFHDYTDGIVYENSISESFAKGLLANIASMSESKLISAFNKISAKLEATNITGETLKVDSGMLSAYARFVKTPLTFPGNYISAEVSGKPYYNPSLSESLKKFSEYRFKTYE